MPRMWFVETGRGTLDPFYNLEQAQLTAKERGTRYWDTQTGKYYTPDGKEDGDV